MKIVLFWFFLGMNSVALTDGRKWDFLELEKQTNFHPPEHYNGLNFEIQDSEERGGRFVQVSLAKFVLA